MLWTRGAASGTGNIAPVERRIDSTRKVSSLNKVQSDSAARAWSWPVAKESLKPSLWEDRVMNK